MVIGAGLVTAALVWTFSQYSASSSSQNQSPADSQDNYPHIERVTVAEAKRVFDQGDAIFVDVRDLEEFEQAHIAGAKSIPVYDIASRTGELEPEDWIITYWTWLAEESSARAAEILLENGFRNATPLRGGLLAWYNAGYPVDEQ